MMGNYFGGGYGYMGGFGFLSMFIFWGLIIWLIVVVMKKTSGDHGHQGMCCGGSKKGDSAETLLRERYAKGEITKEQFEQMKKDLNL